MSVYSIVGTISCVFSLSLRKGDMRRLASIRINYFGVLIIFSRTNMIKFG